MPWQQPWFSVGAPRRYEGTPYRGINAFLLGLRAGLAGHGSPYWMTFKQAKDLGASVRKGERSSLVVYYGSAKAKGTEVAEPNPAGERSRSDEAAGDAGAAGGAYRFLKSYRVFNADQIEGLDATYYLKLDPTIVARARCSSPTKAAMSLGAPRSGRWSRRPRRCGWTRPRC